MTGGGEQGQAINPECWNNKGKCTYYRCCGLSDKCQQDSQNIFVATKVWASYTALDLGPNLEDLVLIERWLFMLWGKKFLGDNWVYAPHTAEAPERNERAPWVHPFQLLSTSYCPHQLWPFFPSALDTFSRMLLRKCHLHFCPRSIL